MAFRLFGKRTSEPTRRIVIGDIHGCPRTFRALVDQALDITSRDHVFLLGDLINKGPDSKSVLAYVLELRDRGVRVELIRGNHEADLIHYLGKSPSKFRSFLDRTDNTALLDNKGKTLDDRWRTLIASSHYYIETGNTLLSHAGFNFAAKDPFSDTDAMLNTKSISYDAEVAAGRQVVHGHVPTPLSRIVQSVASNDRIIPLDNRVVGSVGASPWKIGEYGNLCALDLDTRALYVQPNLDRLENEAVDDTFYSFCLKPQSLLD